MCGIFGYIGKRKTAAEIVFEGIKLLEYRGYDSWGIGILPAFRKKLFIKKRVGKIGNASVDDLPYGHIAFAHTRWATHGGVTQINSHPHLDCTGNIAVIHNGIVENYEELKKDLIKKRHKFISETDSEVIAHAIEELVNKRDPSTPPGMTLEKYVSEALNLLKGLNAFIILDSYNQQLIAVKNGSPLVLGFGKRENFIASDASALSPHTKYVYYMKDNEMAVLNKSKIKLYNTKNQQEIKIKPEKLNFTQSATHLGKFPHYMIKEIYEQPEIIKKILSSRFIFDRDSRMTIIVKTIQQAYGTYLIGCGTAYHAALSGTYIFSKIAGRHINIAVGSEFGYHLQFLTPKSLVIALSQSGETMDIIESVKKAKARGAKIAAITNVAGSTLYRESDYQLLLGAGPEIAVASTKAFTAKMMYLILLAANLSNKVNLGNLENLINKSVRSVLSEKNVKLIKKLATLIYNSQHLYVIGRGLSYPAALETALKIKEISYIHAEGMASGELKHGTLALIERGTPVIVFLPDDETYGANLSGALEMKARGAYIIGISHKSHEVFDYYLPVEDCEDATIIPNVITAQLLAYYLAVEKGLDPDKPRNLAKSVTVK